MPEPLPGCSPRGERGKPATRLEDRHAGGKAWSTGNEVRPLVHGAAYFADLAAEVRKLRAGDLQLFTDWRGDADERLAGDGCTVAGICATPHGAAYWSGPGVAIASGPVPVQRAGKTGTWVRTSKRRAGNACWTCGYGPAARTTRSSPCSATMDGTISGTHKVPVSALTGIARPPPVSRRLAARRRRRLLPPTGPWSRAASGRRTRLPVPR